MTDPVRIGTRGSRLARVQADIVLRLLKERVGLEGQPVIITTSGDQASARRTSEPAPTGAFVKEIERALLDGRIDVAVHSYKDMPTEVPPGLVVAAVPQRIRPEDVLVFAEADHLQRARDALDSGGDAKDLRIATGSPRRSSQLAHAFNCEVVPIRGNVTTRLSRLEKTGGDPDLNGICIAHAGIERLGIRPDHMLTLPIDRFPTAAGQGAIAVETRKDDEFASLITTMEDHGARMTSESERAFLRGIEAGCLTPVGAHARLVEEGIHLLVEVFHPGNRRFRTTVEAADPLEAGRLAAERYHQWL